MRPQRPLSMIAQSPPEAARRSRRRRKGPGSGGRPGRADAPRPKIRWTSLLAGADRRRSDTARDQVTSISFSAGWHGGPAGQGV